MLRTNEDDSSAQRTATFRLAEVAEHHTAKSLWIIVDAKVYDITNFIFDHPGGEEILLQYGGQDVTAVMQDAAEHVHSDSAYDMLEPFFIGNLSKADVALAAADASKRRENAVKETPFIDITKPMLSQVWNSTWTKEHYLKMVHIPRHCHESAPMFGSPLLEVFTKTFWWGVPLFWSPIITYCIMTASRTIAVPQVAASFLGGIFAWTLIEYSLHRFLFHIDDLLPSHPVAFTAHFLLHGIHHYLPMDKMRLVMPPALGFTLAYPIWSAYVAYLPLGIGHAVSAGSMTGFVLYDLMHYYIHHGRPYGAHLREMKSYHLDHHYKNPELGFGITSKLWDVLFGTKLY
ncbi:hypothetical protein BC831DRAFT_404689 [Entophlyctis helioformis]|nr:hypothetical protein BC831DRAFT_404689 [Entophlyctis helioformis]